MNSIPVKVLVAGTIRNGSQTIVKAVHKIDQALEGVASVNWLVIESDSNDNTINILDKLSREKENFRFISLGNLSGEHPRRTDRLAHARNVYLRKFQHSEEYADCTHLIVADLDNVNNLITQSGIESSFKLGQDCVFTSNQSGPYYDIWALRHDLWSPNDCWAELAFYRKWYHWPEYALQKSVLSRMIRIPENEDLIEVNSAFGGLAIYPKESLRDASYLGLDEAGNEVCEHIKLSEDIRNNGFKIFINPKMINTKYTEFSEEKRVFRRVLRLASYPIKLSRKIFKKLSSNLASTDYSES